MEVYGGFVKLQRRAWVLVETGLGLSEKLAGGGKPLAFLGDTLLGCRDTLLVERKGSQAQSEDER